MTLNIFVEAMIPFSRFLDKIENSNEQHLKKHSTIFCNIINVFTVTLINLNVLE